MMESNLPSLHNLLFMSLILNIDLKDIESLYSLTQAIVMIQWHRKSL
jgi:hypothetical protein